MEGISLSKSNAMLDVKFIREPEPMIVATFKRDVPMPNRGKWRTSRRTKVMAKGEDAIRLVRIAEGVVKLFALLALYGIVKQHNH